MPSIAACVLLLCLALLRPVAAGEAQDRLFATGVLDGTATGQRLFFAHERGGSFDTRQLPPIAGGEIELAIVPGETGERQADVTLRDGEQVRSHARLSARGGHPLLVFFLETTARNVATLTGGSPFYLRNRMREALAEQNVTEPVEMVLDGTPRAAERLVFRPFAADRNRARLGAFADLELRVVVSDAVPGGFERFEAEAPGTGGAPAYIETIVFERMEGG
jgi:hypothetical protein